MAGKLIVKNAVPNPQKGEFYYIKNGSIFATKPNRKGGKKGRKVCGASKATKKTATRKKAAKKAAPKKKAVVKKKAATKKVVARKKTAKKAVKKRK